MAPSLVIKYEGIMIDKIHFNCICELCGVLRSFLTS